MKFKQIEQLDKFKKDLKKLLKRFPSLEEDLDSLVKAQLIVYHKLNIDNHGIFAIENLAISSPKIFKVKKFACKSLKGKGVHSGIRVTYAYLVTLGLGMSNIYILFVHSLEAIKFVFVEITTEMQAT